MDLAVAGGLEPEELGIEPATRYQLLVGAVLHPFAVPEHENAVGHAHRREAVRDQHRHLAGGQLREPEKNLVLRTSVERRGGLIENQQLRVAQVGASQRHLLPFAARQVHAALEASAEHLVVAPRQARGHAVGKAPFRRVSDRRLVLAPLDAPHRDVFPEQEVIANEILENDADVLPEAGHVVFPEVAAVEQDPPFSRVVEAHQQLGKRRLAGAVLPDQREPVTRLEREAEVADSPTFGVGVAKSHVLEDESLAHRNRNGKGTGRGADAGRDGEEGEEVVEIEALLVDLGQREQGALNEVPALAERRGEERQHADREHARPARGAR